MEGNKATPIPWNEQEFYMGKLGNFVDRKDENHFKKMAKAFLRGAEYFRDGYYRDKDSGMLKPSWFKVLRSPTRVL